MTTLRQSMALMGGLAPRRRSRAQTVRLLRSRLAGRCESAFLFGSMARGEHHARSDIDLCIVAKTRLPFVERFRKFKDIILEFSPIDLIVVTPKEFAEMNKQPTLFWEYVSKQPWPVIKGDKV